MPHFWPGSRATLLCCCVLLAAGCSTKKTVIAVGARNFTEQTILGEIIAQQLTRHVPDAQVERRFGSATTALTDAAFQAGSIDVFPEYLGAALTAVLQSEPEESRDLVRDQVRQGYRQNRHCEWFGPLGFDNAFALVIPEETAARLGIRTLSQAAATPKGWALGLHAEFRDRPDGLPLLLHRYHLELEAPLHELGLDELYPALTSGKVTMIAAYATDAALEPARFAALQDDLHVSPPCEAGVVVRTSLLQSVPGLANAIKALNGKITAGQMHAMNRRVEFDKIAPERVAADFLKGAGL